MPFVAAIAAIAAYATILTIQPSPLVAYILFRAILDLGYLGGVFYSLAYIRKVAIVKNPVACIKPSIIAFSLLALLGFVVKLWAQFREPGNNIHPIATAIELAVSYAVICIAFATNTRAGFSRMPAESDRPATEPGDRRG